MNATSDEVPPLAFCILNVDTFLFTLILICFQDNSEDLTLHYWALFDGHAGSGAAVMASRLLHHHIALHLQEVMEILCTPNLVPPTCLGEEPINHHLTPSSQRVLTRAASLRGAAGAPGSPSTPPTRFFTEKKVSQESLVIGAIENAFKDMVRGTCVICSCLLTCKRSMSNA